MCESERCKSFKYLGSTVVENNDKKKILAGVAAGDNSKV